MKKSFLQLTFTFLLLFGGGISAFAEGGLGGGDGSATNPYIIKTALDLDSVINSVPDPGTGNAYATAGNIFVLDRNIEINATDFPTGWLTAVSSFEGTLDGNNKTIKFNNAPNAASDAFFITYLSGGTIKNLTLDINGHSHPTGGASFGYLAASVAVGLTAGPNAVIENCRVINSPTQVLASGFAGGIGGLVGLVLNGTTLTITDSYVTGLNISVAGATPGGVGGLIGVTGGMVKIENSFAQGTITANTANIGGLVGSAGSELTIIRSFSDIPVTGTQYVGGLVGFANKALTITHSSSKPTGTITAGTDAGGLVGGFVTAAGATADNLQITESSFEGDITITGTGGLLYQSVGGLVGFIYAAGTTNFITKSYVKGGKVDFTYVATPTMVGVIGGLVGYMGGDATTSVTISECYNASDVELATAFPTDNPAGIYAGGLVGMVQNAGQSVIANIDNCLVQTASIDINSASTGTSTDLEYIGGLVGFMNGTISQSGVQLVNDGGGTAGLTAALTMDAMTPLHSAMGGLVGFAAPGASIDKSYFTALSGTAGNSFIKAISNQDGVNVGVPGGVPFLSVGGIVGFMDNATVSNSFVLTDNIYAIEQSGFTTTSWALMGGIAGWVQAASSISDCFVSGQASGTLQTPSYLNLEFFDNTSAPFPASPQRKFFGRIVGFENGGGAVTYSNNYVPEAGQANISVELESTPATAGAMNADDKDGLELPAGEYVDFLDDPAGYLTGDMGWDDSDWDIDPSTGLPELTFEDQVLRADPIYFISQGGNQVICPLLTADNYDALTPVNIAGSFFDSYDLELNVTDLITGTPLPGQVANSTDVAVTPTGAAIPHGHYVFDVNIKLKVTGVTNPVKDTTISIDTLYMAPYAYVLPMVDEYCMRTDTLESHKIDLKFNKKGKFPITVSIDTIPTAQFDWTGAATPFAAGDIVAGFNVVVDEGALNADGIASIDVVDYMSPTLENLQNATAWGFIAGNDVYDAKGCIGNAYLLGSNLSAVYPGALLVASTGNGFIGGIPNPLVIDSLFLNPIDTNALVGTVIAPSVIPAGVMVYDTTVCIGEILPEVKWEIATAVQAAMGASTTGTWEIALADSANDITQKINSTLAGFNNSTAPGLWVLPLATQMGTYAAWGAVDNDTTTKLTSKFFIYPQFTNTITTATCGGDSARYTLNVHPKAKFTVAGDSIHKAIACHNSLTAPVNLNTLITNVGGDSIFYTWYSPQRAHEGRPDSVQADSTLHYIPSFPAWNPGVVTYGAVYDTTYVTASYKTMTPDSLYVTCPSNYTAVLVTQINPITRLTNYPIDTVNCEVTTIDLSAGVAGVDVNMGWFKFNPTTNKYDSIAAGTKYMAYENGLYKVHVNSACQEAQIESKPAKVVMGITPTIFTDLKDTTISICQDNNYTLSVAASAVDSYQWYQNGNPIPGAVNSSYVMNGLSADNSGRYSVKLIPACPEFAISSKEMDLWVASKLNLTPDSLFGPVKLGLGETGVYRLGSGQINDDITEMIWEFDGPGTLKYDGNSNLNTNELTIDASAIAQQYPLTVTAYHVCGNNSDALGSYYKVSKTITVDGTGIEDTELDKAFAIYPNPFTDRLTIANAEGKISAVKVYNSNGQLIQAVENASGSEIVISAGDWAKGIYVVTATINNQEVSKKVIKQ